MLIDDNFSSAFPSIRALLLKWLLLQKSVGCSKSILAKTASCAKAHALARTHKTLANPYPRIPAMAAGLTNHVWSVEDIVKLGS